MTAEVRPQVTKGVLEPTTNTLAVLNSQIYDYYKIKLGDLKGDFVEVIKLPSVISEGYVTYKGKLYPFSLRDFFRRRVNVGQPHHNTTAGVGADIAEPVGPPTTVVTATAADPNKSSASAAFGFQEHEAANLAWKEQINALRDIDDTQEEWILEDNT